MRSDTGSQGVIGVICAIVGFFTLGIVLGPAAVVLGWFAMGRTWEGTKPVPAVVALILGGIDTIAAALWLAQ